MFKEKIQLSKIKVRLGLRERDTWMNPKKKR